MASVNMLNGEPERLEGTASILAIGTANPPNAVYQDCYPDYYFRVMNSEHMTHLKQKFKRICEKTMIRKRQLYLTEEILKENPNMCTFGTPSFNTRQEMLETAVPKLGQEAALKAINEWGQPVSKITHLVFCTVSGVDMPSADYQLVKLLNLNPSVKRFMIYQQGCSAGGCGLRLAKDIVESRNNANARVLVVCSEIISAMWFHGPSEDHLDMLVGAAIFADGAAAVIVGANPDTEIEPPLFHIVSAMQTIIPGSEGVVVGKLREMGMKYCLKPSMPSLVGNNIGSTMEEAFSPLGISDWNSLFYAAHPGGRAILDRVRNSLGLNEDKLRVSEHILSEYGNMGSPTVFYILDEIRKRSKEQGKSTTGGGLEWGVLIAVGPGLVLETLVLHSVPTTI